MKYKFKPKEVEAFSQEEIITCSLKNWTSLPQAMRDLYTAGKISFTYNESESYLSIIINEKWTNVLKNDMIVIINGCIKVYTVEQFNVLFEKVQDG